MSHPYCAWAPRTWSASEPERYAEAARTGAQAAWSAKAKCAARALPASWWWSVARYAARLLYGPRPPRGDYE